IHASPLYADGKLYVPMQDGGFHILRVSDSGAETLSRVQLEGNCLGAPSVWNGKIYVHTTAKLYCFGTKGNNAGVPPPPAEASPAPGTAARLRVVPAEVLLGSGEKQSFAINSTDINGFVIEKLTGAQWKKFIPPTAKVRSEMDADFNAEGELVAAPEAK